MRDEDGRTYELYLKRLHDVADTAVQKRKRAQAIYRRKLQRMMVRILRENAEAGAGAMLDDEEEEEDSLDI